MKSKVALLCVNHHPSTLTVFWFQTLDSTLEEEAKSAQPAVLDIVTLLKGDSLYSLLKKSLVGSVP